MSSRTRPTQWRVLVVPDGTPSQADQAQRRALAIIADWVRKQGASAFMEREEGSSGGGGDLSSRLQ